MQHNHRLKNSGFIMMTSTRDGYWERKQEWKTPMIEEEIVQRKELGGPKGLEPTRYGDWERKGICYDF